jgi:hypothetical protein
VHTGVIAPPFARRRVGGTLGGKEIHRAVGPREGEEVRAPGCAQTESKWGLDREEGLHTLPSFVPLPLHE